jgi:DNA replication protein DnaC
MSAFLRRVLVMEMEGRKQTAQEKRLKAAKLPTRKTLEAFDFAFQPSIDERQVWELADLSFVKTHRNVVLLGPPGVGKTHLALSLAVKALEANYSVLFTSARQLRRGPGQCSSSEFTQATAAPLPRASGAGDG